MGREDTRRGEGLGAGGQRLDPFQFRRGGNQLGRNVVAQTHDDFDVGDHGRGFARMVDGVKFDRRKALRQPLTILFRAEVQNENLGHANSPRQSRYRRAILQPASLQHASWRMK